MENLKQLRNFLIRRNCVNWIAAIHAVNHPRKTRVKRREKEREGEKIETEGKRKKRRGKENERERMEWEKNGEKLIRGYVVAGLEWKRWKFRRIYRAVFLFIFPQTIFVLPPSRRFHTTRTEILLVGERFRFVSVAVEGVEGFVIEDAVSRKASVTRTDRYAFPAIFFPPSIFIEFFRFSPPPSSSSSSIRSASRIAVIHAARRYFQTDIRHADKFYQHRYPASPMTM